MQDKNAKLLVNEILGYLEFHPNAADTLEGITRWWVTKLLYQRSKSQVNEALKILVESNEIDCISNSNNQILYRKHRT